jgi:hypothetical protein
LCPFLVEVNIVDRKRGGHGTWSEYRHEMVGYSFSRSQIIHHAYQLEQLAKSEALKSLQPKLCRNDERILL